jgi:hypothetical protein
MADTDLAQYEGKKIIVIKKVEGGDAVEIEGTAQASNDLGILIKPKGKTNFDLIHKGDIEEVRYVVEKPKALGRKTLKLVEFGQARNHLLERHGYTLAQVNEIDEKQAFDAHNAIDHVASDLGHEHGDKAKTERVEAIENAGESDED